MIYVIDTCSFTQLKRAYPNDVFPSVWSAVDHSISAGKFRSIELVLDELEAFDDELLDWAKKRKYIFTQLDAATQKCATDILARHTTILDMKKKKSSADPFLIAFAETRSAVVVTEEKFSGGPNKEKIPDVCLK